MESQKNQECPFLLVSIGEHGDLQDGFPAVELEAN